MQLALKLAFAALAAVLLIWLIDTVGDDAAVPREIEDAVRAFHQAACADPRGTLPDGSCE